MGFTLNDIFGTSAAQQVPAPQPAQANPTAPVVATPHDGKPPFEKSTTPDPAPLANFSELFKTTPIDPNAPAAVDPDSPYFTIPTDEQLQQGAQHLKFINTDTHAELLQKASTGDTAALAQVINQAAQAAYIQGAKLSANVAESATRNGVGRVNAALPNQIRSNLARNQVTELNPAFSNPALQPFVQAARDVIEQKFPNATPNEIASLTNQYMEGVRDSMIKTPPKQQSTNGGNNQIDNFGNFFGARNS